MFERTVGMTSADAGSTAPPVPGSPKPPGARSRSSTPGALPRCTVTLRRRRPATSAGGIPEATVARLPVYLRALYGLAERGISTVASEELAAAAGVNSAKLRKDLSHLGSYGIRGVGYDVDYLVYQVSRTLGLTQDWPVVIVGRREPGPGPGQLRRVRLPRLHDLGHAGQRPGYRGQQDRAADRPPRRRARSRGGRTQGGHRGDRHSRLLRAGRSATGWSRRA